VLQEYLLVIISVCVECCQSRAGRMFESQLHEEFEKDSHI